MSTFGSIHRFGCIVAGYCPLFVETEGAWLESFLVLVDFFPIFLTIALFSISFYHYEVYMWLLSFGITFDWLVNYVLRLSLRYRSRFDGCGTEFENPSFSSQHIVCLTTMILTFFLIWSHNTIRIHRVAMFGVLMYLVLVARVYIGVNTPIELLNGGIVGLATAIFNQFIIFYYAAPYLIHLIESDSKLTRFIGLRDTLCNVHPTEHTANSKKISRT